MSVPLPGFRLLAAALLAALPLRAQDPADANVPIAPAVTSGDHMSPLDHLAKDPKVASLPTGYTEGDTSGPVFWIGHRAIDTVGGSGWGWIKKNGVLWSSSQWAVLKETPGVVAAPSRKLTKPDGDLNWEYKLWGTWAAYKAYDPRTDEFLPIFILQGYQVIGAKGALSLKTGPRDRASGRRHSTATARPGQQMQSSF